MITPPAQLGAQVKGTLDKLAVVQGDGKSGVRYESLLIKGTTNADGAFEMTVPIIQGLPRMIGIKSIDGVNGVPDGAKLDMDGLWDDPDLILPAMARLTVTTGVASAGNTGDSVSITSTNVCLACPCRIRVADGGATKKFLILIILRHGA